MASSERAAEFLANLRTRWRQAQRDIIRKLTWSRLYRVTSYTRSALWIVPFFAIVALMITVPMLRVLDNWLQWDLVGLDAEGARALYQTVITMTMSFLIFTFGSLLVAIQIAGGQLTPRVIATTLLRDNVVRYSVGLFTSALLFAVMALNRMQDRVHELVTLLTIILGVASLVVFLFLIDYAARLLRPVSILARVGNEGLGVIETVYPDPVGEDGDDGHRAGQSAGVASPPRHARGPVGNRAGRRSRRPDARGAAHARHGGIRAARGRFSLRRRAALRPLRRRDGHRRSQTAHGCRARAGANDGAGSAVFISHSGGHRPEGVVSGDQRPDDWRARHRSDSSPAAVGRQATPSWRGAGRRPGQPARDLPHAELGGFRPPVLHRDPSLRREQRANRAAPARPSGQPHRLVADTPASGAGRRARRLDWRIKAAYPIDADLALASVADPQGLGGSAATRARS